MEKRVERRQKRDLLQNKSDQRLARIDEYGQLRGVFVERQGKLNVWHISDWWSGDLLLKFCKASGQCELPNGE